MSVLEELASNAPENTRRWTNVGFMLAHRLRRWTNIKPVLGNRLVFAEAPAGYNTHPPLSHRSTCDWKFAHIFRMDDITSLVVEIQSTECRR